MAKKAKQVSNGYQEVVRFTLGVFFLIMIFVLLKIAKDLFGDEFSQFFSWWFTILALGIVFMPLSMKLFKGFNNLGWLFSKVLGIAVTGWLVWYLSSLHILKFTRTSCLVVVGISLVLNAALLVFDKKKKQLVQINGSHLTAIVLSEVVFLLVFIIWMYLKAFKPEAYGTTEKLMDFGFMKAMSKSDYMPPEDLWLAGKDLNYYYVGQFMATYLSKLSNVTVEYGYNLMLMVVAAFGFSLPASIVLNVSRDRVKDYGKSETSVFGLFPYIAGTLSGLAVCFSGNFHYVLYAKFIPWLRVMLGIDDMAESLGYTFSNYWFPNATRYIGYDPDVPDKTIHEFPLYSFVLGDLHAHVVNIIFVLTVVAVLYAYLQNRKSKLDEARMKGIFVTSATPVNGKKTILGIPDFWNEIFDPCIIVTGFLIGLFHTTNFWDFPIYFVVAGAIILFSNATIYNFSWLTVKLTACHAVAVIVIAKLACLPFTISFNQISTGIGLCDMRTPLYQLAILWGIPITVLAVYVVTGIRNLREDGIYSDKSGKRPGRDVGLYRTIGGMPVSDLFIVTIGLCAFGLVLLPEVIYVKDIYAGAHKRANTMFKLTYQSFILFGMMMGYVIPKFIFFARKKGRRAFAIVMGVLLFMTMGYFFNSTKAWFGDYSNPENYKGINAGEYLSAVNLEDYNATNWINENIEGRPVMLEANGDSYTDYCRVSVRTGLPTILGWKTHEWLWQSDSLGDMPAIVSERTEDVLAIYTSGDKAEVSALLEQYNVEYIYVGSLEREKFEEAGGVQHELLQSLGTVIYPSDFSSLNSDSTTYIIKLK